MKVQFCYLDNVRTEFVPPEQTVNGKLYCVVMRRLTEKNADKWRYNSCALHHDKAPAHASLVVQQFLASTDMTVI
jgi:hypothetical protein